MRNVIQGNFLGTGKLLYVCAALAIASIMVVSVCVYVGVKSDIALTLASAAMAGCIFMAFLATDVKRAMDEYALPENKRN